MLAKSEDAQLCRLASSCQHNTLQIVVKQAWCVADFSFTVSFASPFVKFCVLTGIGISLHNFPGFERGPVTATRPSAECRLSMDIVAGGPVAPGLFPVASPSAMALKVRWNFLLWLDTSRQKFLKCVHPRRPVLTSPENLLGLQILGLPLHLLSQKLKLSRRFQVWEPLV